MSLLLVSRRSVLENLNRKPFSVVHHLSDEKLLSLPRLIALAKALPEDLVEYNAGDIPVSMSHVQTPRTGLSVEDTIRRIENCKSWMVLKQVERDPDYQKLLDSCLDEIQQFSEAVSPGMKGRAAFIFISSPHCVTPFHIDPEYNFLLQIRGSKQVHIYPRGIVSERDIEDRFATEHRNLSFDERHHAAGTIFNLVPGKGVHVPIAAPHWVKNGNDVSISFSITFQTAASERQASLYRFNAHLRNLGIQPAPVGSSAFRDTIKLHAFEIARKTLRPLTWAKGAGH
jgi:hypothetical protein